MTYSVDPFREYRIWRRYAYRFLPSFGSALLLGLNNIAINMALSLSYYAKANHLPTDQSLASSGVRIRHTAPQEIAGHPFTCA